MCLYFELDPSRPKRLGPVADFSEKHIQEWKGEYRRVFGEEPAGPCANNVYWLREQVQGRSNFFPTASDSKNVEKSTNDTAKASLIPPRSDKHERKALHGASRPEDCPADLR